MSSSQPVQNVQNHRRRPPPAFAIAIIILLANAVWCVVSVIRDSDVATVRGLFVALALVVIAIYARRNAQVVQDRVIRDEMVVRLKHVLPSESHGLIAALTLPQLVALRFASDAELPMLCAEIGAGRLKSSNDVKQQITQWQADWLRV
jgi:hypothetical protein